MMRYICTAVRGHVGVGWDRFVLATRFSWTVAEGGEWATWYSRRRLHASCGECSWQEANDLMQTALGWPPSHARQLPAKPIMSGELLDKRIYGISGFTARGLRFGELWRWILWTSQRWSFKLGLHRLADRLEDPSTSGLPSYK